jgi:AcrR family transcriptional regulator
MNRHAPQQQATQGSDHRQRILEAARRCFVRSGFHRATMQDVAAEAGMSAGNIYRYFPSKDAIVRGLCALDRAELARSFEALQASSDPFRDFMALGQHHLVDEPRECAVFAVDLWAEASRDPELATLCREFDADIRRMMAAFVDQVIPAERAFDRAGLVDLLLTLADGLMVRRAREDGFSAAPHLPHFAALIQLAAGGHIPSLHCGARDSAPEQVSGAST